MSQFRTQAREALDRKIALYEAANGALPKPSVSYQGDEKGDRPTIKLVAAYELDGHTEDQPSRLVVEVPWHPHALRARIVERPKG